jgi:hypothetical protein
MIVVRGLDGMIDEMDGIADLDDVFRDMDDTMDRITDDIRAHIHRRTGALAASGKTITFSRGSTWHGEARFGEGLSRGYAAFEQERHATHDFLSASEEYATWLVATMGEALA